MSRSSSKLGTVLILTACLALVLAGAAPTPSRGDTVANSSESKIHIRLKVRDIVTPDAQDAAYESELLKADPDYLGEDAPPAASDGAPATEWEDAPAAENAPPVESEGAPPVAEAPPVAKASEDTPIGTFVQGGDTGGMESDSVVTAWLRPDRIKFDGVQAPFVVPDGDSVTWYKIGEEEGGATTIAAQEIKEITDYKGDVVTATVGDVMIFQDGAVAEAIGSVMPSGARGELYNIIACNVQSDAGKCIMVDYDGKEVRETLSKVIEGSTGTIAVAGPTAVPADLSQWANNVMVLNVATVTGDAAGHHRKRKQERRQ